MIFHGISTYMGVVAPPNAVGLLNPKADGAAGCAWAPNAVPDAAPKGAGCACCCPAKVTEIRRCEPTVHANATDVGANAHRCRVEPAGNLPNPPNPPPKAVVGCAPKAGAAPNVGAAGAPNAGAAAGCPKPPPKAVCCYHFSFA